MFRTALILSLMALAAPLGAAAKPEPRAKAPVKVTTPSGLQYEDLVVGTGPMPQRGQACVVHYTGWLAARGDRKGKKFDSSLDRGEPLTIPIGIGRVIKGWDEGVATMRVGGRRMLYIPAPLGYGARGAGEDIPPDARLIFEVQLLAVK
jgi:peptidylprolyl isomerase